MVLLFLSVHPRSRLGVVVVVGVDGDGVMVVVDAAVATC